MDTILGLLDYSNKRAFTGRLRFIQIAAIKVLAAVARGELDLNRLAKEELAARGLNDQGNWIGFDAAKKHHNV